MIQRFKIIYKSPRRYVDEIIEVVSEVLIQLNTGLATRCM